MIKFLLSTLLCIYCTITVSAQPDSCNCPKPSPSQFLEVCQGLYNLEKSEIEGFAYQYQEALWRMSCADPLKDSREVGEAKVRCMWKKYREEFACVNFITSIASGRNVLAFSLENGFPGFIIEMIKRYKVDMNFIDPHSLSYGVSETILDYITRRISEMKKSPPVDQPKIDEFQRIYDFLKSKAVKHGKDL